MKVKLIKKEEAVNRKIAESYNVKNFVTKDFSRNVSLAISEGKNHFEITRNIRSDRIYYVLEGKLKVIKEDEELIVKKGDVIFIPANTKYKFEGTFKAVLVNSPAFNPFDEKSKLK